MGHEISRYIRRHTLLVATLVVLVFLGLVGGEYFLYRKVMIVNKMLSEGLMQMKENIKKDQAYRQASEAAILGTMIERLQMTETEKVK